MATKAYGLVSRTLGTLLKRDFSSALRTKHLYASQCKCVISSSDITPVISREYSHHPPFPYPDIRSQKAARQFALLLDDQARTLLIEELTKQQKQKGNQEMEEIQGQAIKGEDEAKSSNEVSRTMLREVVVFHGIPFVGFGILDNMVMIIAGEYIDVTIGMTLGISTMAAAALGNLISDLAGIGTAGYVELIATKFGITPPDLTQEQAHTWQVRWSVGLGRSLGITVGCLIGMFPLLFFNRDEDKEVEKKEVATQVS